jgi:Domain of unknown function (DUF1707)
MTGEVSPARGPGQGQAPLELRASHADRDRVVEVLRIAAGDGRITSDELDQRLEVALTARTLRELAVLTTDLPEPVGHHPAVLPPAKDLVRIECGSGSARRDGPWVVPRRMEVRVTSGTVRLDFSEAVITAGVLEIAADVKSGSLTLLTRPGIVVDAGEVSVSSGSVRVKPQPGPAEPVILRVEVSGIVRSGSISARPLRLKSPRRTFLEWLARRPKRPPVLG